jgi:hypothetical protein
MAFGTGYPQILANLAAGNQPLSTVDSNFTPLYNGMNLLNTYSNYYADSGAANAYVITLATNQTLSLAAGLRIQFLATSANTGASTLNSNGSGVKNILNLDGSALVKNQIPANGIVDVIYDGTQYLLLNPATVRGTFTITLTGFTANPTGTAVYSVTNNVVTLFIPALTATSNATTMTATGLPAAIQPATQHGGLAVGTVNDNGGTLTNVQVASVSGGTVTF